MNSLLQRVSIAVATFCVASTAAYAQNKTPGTPKECRNMVADYYDAVYDSATKTRKAVDVVALEAGMIKRARECASRFNLNTVKRADLAELGTLYVIADNAPAAKQAFRRITGDTTLPAPQRAQAVIAAIQGMRKAYIADSGAIWAEKYLPVIDSLPGLAFEKFKARSILIDYYLSVDIDDKIRKTAGEMLSLARQMTPEEQKQQSSYITGAYSGLATLYGSNLQPDSALALARSAPAEFPVLDSLLKSSMAPIITRYEMIGKKVPKLSADVWLNDSASVVSNQPMIVVFTANWCIACRRSYPTLMRLNEAYGKGYGLRTIVAVTLDGSFEGVPMEAAQEIEANKKYFIEKYQFPYPIAIQRTDETAQASTPRNLQMFNVGVYPQYFVIDKTGIIRAILMGWDLTGHREKMMIEAVRQAL